MPSVLLTCQRESAVQHVAPRAIFLPGTTARAMAAWFEWLAGLLTSPPVPGTHEATLEEMRLGALYTKAHKGGPPRDEREEARVHKLRLDYLNRKLANTEVRPGARWVLGRWRFGGVLLAPPGLPGVHTYAEVLDVSCDQLHASQLHEHPCNLLPCRPRQPSLLAVQPALRCPLSASAAQPVCGYGSAWLHRTELCMIITPSGSCRWVVGGVKVAGVTAMPASCRLAGVTATPASCRLAGPRACCYHPHFLPCVRLHIPASAAHSLPLPHHRLKRRLPQPKPGAQLSL